MSRIKFLDALPGTMAEIMHRAMLSNSMARKLALECHAAGEIHISSYFLRIGTPSKIYARGPGVDAQPPKPPRKRSRQKPRPKMQRVELERVKALDVRVAVAVARNRAVFPLAAVWGAAC